MGLFISGILAQYLGWQSPFYLYGMSIEFVFFAKMINEYILT